ncbi:MAG: ATP-binding cassette domain-containing protein [Acidobacteria bacterium]|jgi:ABC-type multidrug transport system ATPase subunit|nr:ATP-binding cassette domain-containing protein [Acidobacteriota bacterium]
MKTIEIKNLKVYASLSGKSTSPNKSGKMILKEIFLSIEQENICIMGESGSGKTTLLNVISGNLPTSLKCMPDTDIKISPNTRIFTLFQDADLYLSSHHSLYYYLKLAMGINKWDPLQIRQYTDILKISITLPYKYQEKLHPDMTKYWKKLSKDNLSGGNKQKFMIMLGLLVNPDVMLLDETFTDIDEQSQDKIIELLFAGKRRILMVSHDYERVKRLVEEGKIGRVYYISNGILFPHFWEHGTILPQWVESMEENYQGIEAIIRDKEKEKLMDIQTPRYQLIRVFHAYGKCKVIDYNGDKPLPLTTCHNYAITGENGVGKTTLVKILMKLEPYKGNIHLWGNNGDGAVALKKILRATYMKQHQLVFQKTGNSMQAGLTLKDFLLAYFKPVDREIKWKRIEEFASHFSLDSDIITRNRFSQLSVGQQRRVMLIRALLLLDECPNGCLFIDEAMRGMDISLKRRLVEYLNCSPHQVFLISHDEQLRKALCHKELRIENIKGVTYFRLFDIRR